MTSKKASFSKSERLKRAEEFQNMVKKVRSVRDNGIVLYFSVAEAEKSRLGILVSKKALKNAVDRNRAKRKIREFFRTRKNRFSKPHDLIVRVIDGNQFKDCNVEEALTDLFSKAKVL